jgi:two-component system sensor histidine kinase UhpB
MVIWDKLPLRVRINCLVALVLALGLVANVTRLALDAAPRVQAEDQSVIRLTREVIESIGPGFDDAPDPNARLDKFVADLNRLRHVSVLRQDDRSTLSSGSDSQDRSEGGRGVPSWFVALIHPERTSLSVPVTIGGKQQALTIVSHPDDEVQEIWDGIVNQLTLSVIVALVLFIATSLVVRRALTPLDALSQAMADIEGGDYQTRVATNGAPELAALCARLNHLTTTLDHALEDRRRLAERIVSLQDTERKEIARELHDEFGPYLFALRAHASAVSRLADHDAVDTKTLSKHGTAILAQVDALQQFNRRVLERLRPVGLADFGLSKAIEVLLRLWRESHPDIIIESRISLAHTRLGESADLTVYRVVQEALTNAFRHAGATTVSVSIEPVAGAAKRDAVLVRVHDNGRGFDPNGNLGFGLTGMRERVWAMGGTLNIYSDKGGVTVEAIIPAMESTSVSSGTADRELVPAFPRQ